MQARDIMTTTVETVHPETPVLEVARKMASTRISGMPVVDVSGHLVGIVTERDLLRRTELGTERSRESWLRLITFNRSLADEYAHAHGRAASDVMTRSVVTVTPTASLRDVVDLMERNLIKRVPVVENGRLVGIISRANLVQALGTVSPATGESGSDDLRIRDLVLSEFRRLPWGLKSDSNVMVSNAVVHLWGLVGTTEEQTALRIAAQNVPGVRDVSDHTFVARDIFSY